MSIAFTYASYTKYDSDLVSNALWVTVANCGFENFAAIVVFSILGYMSLQSGVAVPDVVTQGTGLDVYKIQVSGSYSLNFSGSFIIVILHLLITIHPKSY